MRLRAGSIQQVRAHRLAWGCGERERLRRRGKDRRLSRVISRLAL